MIVLWVLLSLINNSQCASCKLVPPLASSSGQDIGLIIIPGAQIEGLQYGPLVTEIQNQLPGARLWAGLTKGWLGNFPNPLEIQAAVDDCTRQASAQGLEGSVYMAGHSLGGIMLETWVATNPTQAKGIILLGSYLPDLFGSHNNSFPVPVLTAVGSLDGLTLSYVYREWLESQEAETILEAPGRFPVHVIKDSNHAQVASEPIPDFVLSQDLYSSLSQEEAHRRYATSVTAFITTQDKDDFTEEQVAAAETKMKELKTETEVFLEPFRQVATLEKDGDTSPWVSNAQLVLLGPNQEEFDNLQVTDIIVPFSDLGAVKPKLNSTGECQAVVTTYCQPQYETSLADANILNSAKVIKAKFKLEDVVREALCLEEQERRQCKDINILAFETALAYATDDSITRFSELGTQLIFSDDSVSPWGPGWEYSSGLHYTPVNGSHTQLHSTSLISGPDFFIPSAAGMHYCDLLSPYRALEWIYIKGLQGKYPLYTSYV